MVAYDGPIMDTIGVLADPDHPVFGGAAERLAARGFYVDLYPPADGVEREGLADLDAFAVADLGPDAIEALRRADGLGVETLNGAFAATALGSRLVAYHALAGLGCPVPRVWTSAPTQGPTRRRGRFRWPDPRGPDGGFHQEVLPADAVRQRYYAVDDGVETHVTAIGLKRRLRERSRIVEDVEVEVERATRLRTLLERFGARTVAVDFAGVDGEWYAIDVDPAPSYAHAGMERHLADALASLTTIGA